MGKSAFALALAQRVGGVVVNADSMQCYTLLPILSAQPTMAEQQQVPHYLYGFAHDAVPFSVAHWLGAVQALLHQRTTPLIIVGGTGLFFYALCNGLAQVPALCPQVRAQVRLLNAADAWQCLQHEDPAAAQKLHPADTQRIKRALEVMRATGHGLQYWQSQTTTPLLAEHNWRSVVLEMPRDILYTRIDQRFNAMMQQGAVAEVLSVHNPQSAVWQTLGARQLQALALGQLEESAAIEQAQMLSRRYAKQQITRFKNMLPTWPRANVATSAQIEAALQDSTRLPPQFLA